VDIISLNTAVALCSRSGAVSFAKPVAARQTAATQTDILISPSLATILSLAQEAEPHSKGPLLSSSVRQERGRVNVIVDHVRVATISDVIESETPRPKVMQETELTFEV
jgi:hypothetical protein